MATLAEELWDRGEVAAPTHGTGRTGGNGADGRPDMDLQRLLRAGAVRFDAALGFLGAATLMLFFPLETPALFLLGGGGLCFWSARERTGKAVRFIGRWMPRVARQPDVERIRRARPVLGLHLAVSILSANVILLRWASGKSHPHTRPVEGQPGEFEVITPWPGSGLLDFTADSLHWLCIAGIAALVHFRTAYVEAHRRLQMADLMDEMREVRSRRFASDYGGGAA